MESTQKFNSINSTNVYFLALMPYDAQKERIIKMQDEEEKTTPEQDKTEAKKCGIYCIRNTVNQNFLIGKSLDIAATMAQHKEALEAQLHPNRWLQAEHNEQAGKGFEFITIKTIPEGTSRTELTQRLKKIVKGFNTTYEERKYNTKLDGSHGLAKAIKKAGWQTIEERKTLDKEELLRLHYSDIKKEEQDREDRAERMKGKTYAKGSTRTAEQREAMAERMKGKAYAKGSRRTPAQRIAQSEKMKAIKARGK